MIISRTGRKSWTNRHETFTQQIDNLYDLANENTGNELNDYNDTTTGVQQIIRDTVRDGKHLRVLGGEWSWTRIAAVNGILLNTKPLNITFEVGPGSISPSYARSSTDLYFAQCGVSIKELNDRLADSGRSLKTTGASNGQTIAGGMSTGTHGSAIDIGAIPDYVVGLHIIVSPTRHVWLERSSYPVASDLFVSMIGAELVRDDDMFNAALVSFGSFGFIHGIMVETVPLFVYECYRKKLILDNDLYALMETLDFSTTRTQLPHGQERPYHFQVLINQYDTSNQAYVTVMYKREYDPAHKPPPLVTALAPGDDAPVFIGTISEVLPNLVPGLVNFIIGKSYAPYDNVWGTHGQIFFNTDTHGKVLSMAIGIALADVNKVRELFLQVNTTAGPFTGVLAFRYVKGTKATLGFTKFDHTCIIELDGVFSDRTQAFYQAFWDALDAQGIQYTFHWGKVLRLDGQRLRKMYGTTAVDAWVNARNELMKDAAGMVVFTNESMVSWGLDAIRQVEA